jgi:hypothetical protein
MHTTRSWLTAVTLTLGMAAAFTAAAAPAETAATETIPSHPMFSDKFLFEFGGYYARTSTGASLSGPGGGVGAIVDFEDAFALEERKLVGIGGFVWRMTERWRLDVEYFLLNRRGTKTLDNQLEWGGETFPSGTTVDARYNFSDTRVTAGYSFFKRRDKELGIGLGLHVAGIKASVEDTAGGITAQESSVQAPLPVVNLYGLFALTDDWALRMRMDFLSLAYGDYSGDIRSAAIDALYQPFRNVGFGLGMRSLIVDLKVDDPDWTGRIRTSYSGPTAFMTVSF